jgi:hypothetical protein
MERHFLTIEFWGALSARDFMGPPVSISAIWRCTHEFRGFTCKPD